MEQLTNDELNDLSTALLLGTLYFDNAEPAYSVKKQRERFVLLRGKINDMIEDRKFDDKSHFILNA